MSSITVKVNNEEETRALGKAIGQKITPPLFIALVGPLGAGKTLISKAIAEEQDINPEEVTSPTFTIMNIYEGKYNIYHYDFYRLESESEFVDIGVHEFLESEDAIVLAEWAEKAQTFFPKDYLQISFDYGEQPTERVITFSARGKKAEEILVSLKI